MFDDALTAFRNHQRKPGRQLGQSPYDEEDEPYLNRVYELEIDAEIKKERFSVSKAAKDAVNEDAPSDSADYADSNKREKRIERIRKRYPKWKSNKVGE